MISGNSSNSRVPRSNVDVIKSGISVPGDSGNTGNPVWLDVKKIERAKQLYHQHFASILFSHLMGLTFLVTIPSIFKTLVSTGKSSNTVLLLRRYLKTLSEVRKWYEGDIVHDQSEARESIQRVRHQHSKVATTNHQEGDRLRISQYDMAMTQFAFLGFLILYPKKMGIWCNQDDLQCLAHFWRFVAHLLGAEDRYNLVTNNWEETLTNCRHVSRHIYATAVRDASPEAIEMSKGIVKSMSSFLRILRWRAMIAFQLDNMGVYRDITMDLRDCLGYAMGRLVYGFLLKFGLIRWLYNSLVKYLIENATKDVKFYEKRLSDDTRDSKGYGKGFVQRLRLRLRLMVRNFSGYLSIVEEWLS